MNTGATSTGSKVMVLARNIQAIAKELSKPETVATLRMTMPELYAQLTALVAVYDAHVKDHIDREEMLKMRMQAELQKHVYDQQVQAEKMKAYTSIQSMTGKPWI